MKRSTLLVCALLIAILQPTTASEESAALRITEIHPRPLEGSREFIEVWNPTSASVSLDAWTITDGPNTFTFDAWILGPNQRVVVWGGGNDSTLGPTWKANVWNNGGDTATLRNPSGLDVDTVAYGTTDVPVPDEGWSIHFEDSWVHGEPTAGQGPEAADGSAAAQVSDVPPSVDWGVLPLQVRPGDNATIEFEVREDNGDAVAWIATADGQSVAQGNDAGIQQVQATAPASEGQWVWSVTVQSTSHEVTITTEIHVQASPLRVILPEEGIHFEGLVPGAENVVSARSFIIQNDGDAAIAPIIDVSPFAGAVGAIPVQDNLLIRLVAGGVEIPYEGPLQALPALGPGASHEVELILLTIPSPLPAGEYRSSFTVVE